MSSAAVEARPAARRKPPPRVRRRRFLVGVADHSLLIAASIPGAQLCIVPGTTHGLIGERPELVSLLIQQFLAADRARERRSRQLA